MFFWMVFGIIKAILSINGNEKMEDGQSENDAPEEVKVRVSDAKEESSVDDELEKLSAEAQDDFGTKVKEEMQTVSNNINDSYAERGHVYKNHGFYAFRYVIMLISGAAFLAALVSILSITISKLVDEDFYVSSWAGPMYANLATTVVILGIIHLFVSMTVGKNWRADDGEKKKYPIVLSVIYSVGLGVAMLTYLVLFLGTLFGSMIGLNDAKGADILEQFLITLVAILVFGFALVYKLNLLKNIPKAVYVVIMGAFAMVGVILFLAFPAKEIRDTIHDNNVVRDLNKIEMAVNDYYDENRKLPETLEGLFEKDELNYSVKEYKYTPTQPKKASKYSSYSYPVGYEICADFRTNTEEEVGDYSYLRYSYDEYDYHQIGNKCFDVTVYYGGGAVYDDDDYYANNFREKWNNSFNDDEDDYDWSWLDDDDEDEDDENVEDDLEIDWEALFEDEEKDTATSS